MPNLFCDLETYSPIDINAGSHKYAERVEILLFAYALDNGPVQVWDLTSTAGRPDDLTAALADKGTLVWFHNGGGFDFVMLSSVAKRLWDYVVPMTRWRDTMVQAYLHGLPGGLAQLGDIFGLKEDQAKHKDGRDLVRLFCKPQTSETFIKKHGTARPGKHTHPEEWARFVEYARQDIVAMRHVHAKMPKWNLTEKQWALWRTDLAINYRGFAVDMALAEGAVEMARKVQDSLSDQVDDLTVGAVGSANQRDALLDHLRTSYGIDMPDLQADTVERRLNDPELFAGVREILEIRLQSSMNSVAKYKAVLKGVNTDGRMRGCMQFRGAARTGRWAHRMFQPGNLPRSTLPQSSIDLGIEWIKAGQSEAIDLAIAPPMQLMSNAIRGVIVAPPGKKLVVSDLSSIEGRVAPWLTGEDWKLQAYRDFDAGNGADLYVTAYAKAFNVPVESVTKSQRAIGKVMELMFAYGGGVGAWITGAATYGIDLDAMTKAVMPVLPKWAVDEAEQYAQTLTKQAGDKQAAKAKALHGLKPGTFIACDAIKRMWRKANSATSSYWSDLGTGVKNAILAPGTTVESKRLAIRCDGSWLRIKLPSGRLLCYPGIQLDAESGELSYLGVNQYVRRWERIKTYGAKLFENVVQAVACDQLAECMPLVESSGYQIVLHVHDELVCETPDAADEYSAEELSSLMCSRLNWNDGLPLAAKGFECYRYRKE